MDDLKRINERYHEESHGIYPFITKNKIMHLKAGFYQKKTAKYRGVSFIYDKQMKKNKAILIGFFYVPNNYIIVPDGALMTGDKKESINRKLNEGYELLTKFPSLKPYEFDMDSQEYKVAEKNSKNYKSTI